MVPYRYDPEHIAAANDSPRCQHIKLSGHRCGAPARRRRRFCHFHERLARPKAPANEVRFIEDAASLQLAIMEVLRELRSASPDYRACGLSLYGLQIACTNLRNLQEEQAALEPEEDESLPADEDDDEYEEDGDEEEPQDDEPSLAEILLGSLAKPVRDDDEPPPRIRSKKDFYAAMKKYQPGVALPEAPEADK